MDDGKKYLVCIILLLNECMQDVVKVQRTVPSSRGYVIMRVPKRVDFVCPHCDTSPCFTLFLFLFFSLFPSSLFLLENYIYKTEQKCLSTLANVRINTFPPLFKPSLPWRPSERTPHPLPTLIIQHEASCLPGSTTSSPLQSSPNSNNAALAACIAKSSIPSMAICR